MKHLFKFGIFILFILSNSMIMKAQEISVMGIAYNVKGGAIIQTDSVDYWIEGKEFWEEIYFEKKIEVTGTLKQFTDNRVFVDTAEIKIQGIPVKTKEEKDNYPKMLWIMPSKIEIIEE